MIGCHPQLRGYVAVSLLLVLGMLSVIEILMTRAGWFAIHKSKGKREESQLNRASIHTTRKKKRLSFHRRVGFRQPFR